MEKPRNSERRKGNALRITVPHSTAKVTHDKAEQRRSSRCNAKAWNGPSARIIASRRAATQRLRKAWPGFAWLRNGKAPLCIAKATHSTARRRKGMAKHRSATQRRGVAYQSKALQ